MMNTFSTIVHNNCDDKGRQNKISLSSAQKKGLSNIRKKAKEGDIIVLETEQNYPRVR